MDISDWIRCAVGGETYTVDQTVQRIRDRATNDLGPLLVRLKVCHMFSLGVFHNGRTPWVVQLRNFSVTREDGFGPPRREFLQIAREVPQDSGVVVPWPMYLSTSDMTQARLSNVSARNTYRAAI